MSDRAIEMVYLVYMSTEMTKMLNQGLDPYEIILETFYPETDFEKLRSELLRLAEYGLPRISMQFLRALEIEENRANAKCMGPYR